jgi:homospermidine synthase
MQPGMNTMVKSWCPTPGPQLAFMITHDESLSIADYYTVEENN